MTRSSDATHLDLERLVELERILDEEMCIAEARATERIAPLLQQEFKRVCERNPRLQKVLFGNGTSCYVGKPDYASFEVPRDSDQLTAMCALAAGTRYFLVACGNDLVREVRKSPKTVKTRKPRRS